MKSPHLLLAGALLLAGVHHSLFAQEISYKGLKLGMDQNQLNTLVANSNWSYGDKSGAAAKKARHDGNFTSSGAYLNNTDSFACTAAECYTISSAMAKFYKRKIFQIIVMSATYSRTEVDSLNRWVSAFEGVLIQQFGPPANQNFPREQAFTLQTLDTVHSSSIAEWRWMPASGKKTVRGKTTGEPEPLYTVIMYVLPYGANTTIFVTLQDCVADRARTREMKGR